MEKAPHGGFALGSETNQRIPFLKVQERAGLFHPLGVIDSRLRGLFMDSKNIRTLKNMAPIGH